jgi:hypothetical protein
MPHTIRETSGTKVTAVNLSYLTVSRTPYRAPSSFVFCGGFTLRPLAKPEPANIIKD